MGKFVTAVPVNLTPVLSALPPGAAVQTIRYADWKVEVVWEHDGLWSKYTFPVEYPAALLEKQGIPDGVRNDGDVFGGAEEPPERPKRRKG